MSRSVFLVLVAAAFWGTTGAAAFWLGTEVSPVAIGAVTMGVGGVILALTGARHTLATFRDKKVRVWLIVGALGVVVYPLTFYWGMSLAGIAVGNVIALGLGPITVALLEWIVSRSRPHTLWWLSSATAVIGVWLISSADVELGEGRIGNLPLGIFLATVAGVSYGVFTYAFGRLIDAGHSPRGVVGAVFGAGSPILLGVVVWLGGGLFSSLQHVGLLSYLIIGPMVLAYLAFSQALVVLRSSTVATVALMEPVIAALLAVLVIGEKLGPLAILGGFLVILAIVALGRESGERGKPNNAYS